jgi:DNA-binding CsgD family transcriptional regulator
VQRRQRNKVMLQDELSPHGEHRRTPLYRDLFVPWGIGAKDQIRVVLSDGPAMLAFVGGVRLERFGAREKHRLAAMVPALQKRLWLERQLGDGALARAALDAVLEQVGRAAFIVNARGAVHHANRAGRSLLERRDMRERLTSTSFERLQLAMPGGSSHFLVVERRPDGELHTRLASARVRWGLTPRQAEVLAVVAQGEANKTIAVRLGCSLRTVEVHVTALFDKAQVDSRAALIAALWAP